MELQRIERSEKFDNVMNDFCFDTWLQKDIRMRILAILSFIGKKQKEKIDKELESVRLTGTQVQMMLYILHCNVGGRVVTAKDLETYFRVKNSTVSGILKRLEKKELIERVADEHDKRNKQIRIKGGFAGMCGSIDERIKEETEKMFHGFSKEEEHLMFQLLTKLLYNVDRNKAE